MQKAEPKRSQLQNQPAQRHVGSAARESPQGEPIAQLEAMADASHQAGKLVHLAVVVNSSPGAVAQRKAINAIHSSPHMTAQRRQLDGISGAAMQRSEAQSRQSGIAQTKYIDSCTQSLHQKLPGNLPVQLAVNVDATQYEGSVYIEAEGQVSDFKGGDEAGDYGWNGVEKYTVKATVDGTEIDPGGTFNNSFIVAQSGHVLAEQNGGKGSDPNNVFAQDGGVNNGPYRTYFENPMRRALDAADDDADVKFEAALEGEDISKGKLIKESKNLFVK